MSKNFGKAKICISIEHTLEDLCDAISWLSEKEVFWFIKQLDLKREDLDFTRDLRDYFVKEIEEEEKHVII